jgi:hypothetical protein
MEVLKDHDLDNPVEYEAAVRVLERLSRRHPDDIFRLTFDDSYHASSDLFIVTHRSGAHYMGATFLFFSQCDGQPMYRAFFYPPHASQLSNVLAKLDGYANADPERQELLKLVEKARNTQG